MWPRFRSPSLFWTFAGAFLVVLVIATILQGVIVMAVVEPLASRWAGARAELLGREVAREIGAALEAEAPTAPLEILRARSTEPGVFILLYREPDGNLIGDRRLPRHLLRRLRDQLDAATTAEGSGQSGDRTPSPGSHAERRGLAGHRRRSGGAFWREPPWMEGMGDIHGHRLLGRAPVVAGGESAGEVVVLTMPRRFLPRHPAIPSGLLLFLPIAVLIAGGAGLILFRLMLRRLRELENLAARVTAGDLDARVAQPGGDEIGRLGERMNRMTASLADARRYVESGDRQRRQLLADISHELATPLTSIRGYAETMLDPTVPVSEEEEAQYVCDILDEAKRMDFVIQDLLDLTRLEAGAIQLHIERLDWTALARHTMNRFQARFREAGLTLSWEGPAGEAWVEADGHRLEQVLDNLLVNALRYVPEEGSVVLLLEAITAAEPRRFALTVRDDGPGFPAADLPHVFDRFYRADAARSMGGSGLGLAIVQEIVRRHHGAVRAENLSPRGAAIIVELPATGQESTGRGSTGGESTENENAGASAPR